MHDPFEESLRDLLKNAPSSQHDDDATLDRVLKTANRQVGVGDLFSLMGNWFEALMIALNAGSRNVESGHAATKRCAEKAE
ncbi:MULTISPECIES: hypothetical protein [Pseudomonas]|uniref:CrfX protein n=1 Tax=Pseudomonas flexibilis TaxID=706570 RepID=A0A0B3BN62_9PSED|nr:MULTISPECIES: hypothetical protein [Pseudomonas]KHL68781.1 CrfX protein [Pseudomonas flexibilis]KHO65928.1 CrfX protein [Pseudomonas flexibilis]SCX75128.1 hypothetical protein SAMN02927929_00036 [Pseudomonas flexibilis]SIQ20268.1 hypothetical protein SAMN05421672_10432 [Pseudomonas flexibilis]